MKKLCTLAALALVSFGIAACDDTSESTVTESAVVNGTEVETTTTRSVDTDNDGDTTIEVEQERTVDPEGLMNQETTTQEYERTIETDR
jgi:uncharacterized lipoprotein YehR (DUF1307 family)